MEVADQCMPYWREVMPGRPASTETVRQALLEAARPYPELRDLRVEVGGIKTLEDGRIVREVLLARRWPNRRVYPSFVRVDEHTFLVGYATLVAAEASEAWRFVAKPIDCPVCAVWGSCSTCRRATVPAHEPPEGFTFEIINDSVSINAPEGRPYGGLMYYRPTAIGAIKGRNADPRRWPPELEAARQWAAHLLGETAEPLMTVEQAKARAKSAIAAMRERSRAASGLPGVSNSTTAEQAARLDQAKRTETPEGYLFEREGESVVVYQLAYTGHVEGVGIHVYADEPEPVPRTWLAKPEHFAAWAWAMSMLGVDVHGSVVAALREKTQRDDLRKALADAAS